MCVLSIGISVKIVLIKCLLVHQYPVINNIHSCVVVPPHYTLIMLLHYITESGPLRATVRDSPQ